MECLSRHGYIRNTPSDTEVHAEDQLRVDRSASTVKKNTLEYVLRDALDPKSLEMSFREREKSEGRKVIGKPLFPVNTFTHWFPKVFS